LSAHARPDGSVYASNIDGMTTGFYLGDGSEWLYDRRIHTGATAWKSLAELEVNVLSPDLYLNEDDCKCNSGVGTIPVQSAFNNAYIRNGILYVNDLPENEDIKVYSIDGTLIAAGKQVKSFSHTLPARGIYIVGTGKNSMKLVY
jgi:hypothetical protein